MTRQSPRILIVEPAPEIVEILVASLSRRLDAHITCVADAESCLDSELGQPHDLIIAEFELLDSDGLRLARELLSLGSRPIILLASNATCAEIIEAMRLGVRDVFRKPFPVAELLESVERLIGSQTEARRRAARYHSMRELVRHVVRERRDLNRRVDLVCRDLVNAHRRLVQRMTEAGG